MKYFVIFFILIGFIGVAHAYHNGTLHPTPNADMAKENFTLATVKWSQLNYRMDNGTDTAKVIVTDPDMNKISNVADTLNVSVFSDSFQEGIFLKLYETEKNSGIFERTFTLSEERSAPSVLFVSFGDTATVKYTDAALPTDNPFSEIVLMETTLIGHTGPPLERVPASDFRLSDIRNLPITGNSVSLDQQIQLISDLENQQNYTQPFAYLVTIQNEKGQTESLSWITGNLTSYQKISSGVTWIPVEEGKYTATAFVWESINNPTALSPPNSLDFVVSFDVPSVDKSELIPLDIASVEDRYIHLNPTDTCATISLRLLTLDDLEQNKSRDKEVMFFEVNEKDLREMPVLDELIRATHYLQSPPNDFAQTEMDMRELVDYEFFIMEKSIEKYNDSQDDYFMKLDSDLDKRLADPAKQGFSNEFIAPQIIYNDKIYVIGHTVFWVSDEHEMQSLSVHLQKTIDEDEKFITLTDTDMTKIPKLKQAIEKIGTELESIVAFKGMPENPDWNEYREWFDQKKTEYFNPAETYIPGFVYEGEYYDLGFPIC